MKSRPGLLVICLGLAACQGSNPYVATSKPLPPAPPQAPRPPPPMSSPLPPRLVKEAVAVDTTCKSNADCAVKNVGNCCGAMPACVNKDSPTDPAAVQAQCNAKGMMGVCGFKEISACQCDNGQCAPVAGAERQVQ